MAHQLPRLRMSLDFLPSPDPQRPGLLIRDPYQFTGSMLLIPPQLVESLACFDGEQTELDLRQSLVQATGEIQVGELEKHLLDSLSNAGFLEDETFDRIRSERIREFAAAPVRMPSHAGSAYPDDADEARAQMDEFMRNAPAETEDSLVGIAAPHVSPFGGWESYRDAYAACLPAYKDRTFVILGTSHYGEPDHFGLTRKSFITPLGETKTDVALVDRLAVAAPGAVNMEDYCHAVEHSIEFQVLFLQHLYGADIRILPILCGSYAQSLYRGGKPEANEDVRRFLEALGEVASEKSGKLFFVLGVDMAHMGRRYGDEMVARADDGEMLAVAERDKKRIECIQQSDADGFWSLVQENQDDLKWCGSAPIYTFLKAVPNTRGSLRRYQQWNIDEQSVVSFAALSFRSY
ncbi:MAG TPA: AmmeMemoRadiSam system protein B [Bryobacteraceae bacterium]|nr:AmmeMemoRadiSam system protein B [Bryobacteraceae bacterium]